MATHGVMPRSLGKLNRHARACDRAGRDGCARERDGADELQQVTGRGFVSDAGRHRREPSVVFSAIALAVLWMRGARPAANDLLVLGTIGTLYSVFASSGSAASRSCGRWRWPRPDCRCPVDAVAIRAQILAVARQAAVSIR
jgi:hypothetical protein